MVTVDTRHRHNQRLLRSGLKEACMHPRTLALAVAIIVILAIVTPIVVTRYSLTSAGDQRGMELIQTTDAGAMP
jgi:hypothetical protein